MSNSVILAGTGSGLKGLVLVTSSIHDECLAVSEAWKDTLAATRHVKIKGTPSAIALSADNRRVACANYDGGIELYKMPKSVAGGGAGAKEEENK